ncbi:carbohydrate-binding protein [Streptomyces spongiae]|uniref:carbohydrate-binding protein n=1 Tax=Streptomyces spongiae TaxID=565072 RepID=UPI002AD4B54A|nr:carbohydrate-binding protein [Streptomyces spongiae]
MSASTPAQPSSPQGRAPLSRRTFLTAAAVAAAAGAELVLPGRASAAPSRPRAAGSAQVTWSSESTASGYAPMSGTWYADPATGLAAVPYKLSQQDDIALAASGRNFGQVINIDPAKAYQSMLGVGSSMEDSTIHNLALMRPAVRTKVLRALFDPTSGAGFNITRICFGTSDFSHTTFYSYDDGPADPTLSRFSIQKDVDNHIISTLRDALRINPDLIVFGTAWSPPAWMKDNNSLIGGHLLDEHIPTLARYYRKIVQAYAEQGITIHAMTPQNEPLYAAPYPSMLVTSQQEAQLVDAMRANFAAGMLGTSDSGCSDTYRNTKAIAFHDYDGDPGAMSLLKTKYPGLDMAMTERMLWGTAGADRIARYMRRWSTTYVAWVTMLDQNRDAQQYGAPDPTPLIQNPDNRDTYWALPEYYLFAQFSKFIKRGAKRIWSDYGSAATITTVAFLNPDGTIATVVVNQTSSAQQFTLRSGQQQLIDAIPPKTAGTYVWTPSTPPATTSDAYSPIQAEAYGDASGVAVEVTADTTGGEDIGSLSNGDWAKYGNVAFGAQAATQFKARVASGAASGVSGRIEVRLDSRSSTPVGSITVENTGGWQTWTTKTADISGNLNWFTFTR